MILYHKHNLTRPNKDKLVNKIDSVKRHLARQPGDLVRVKLLATLERKLLNAH